MAFKKLMSNSLLISEPKSRLKLKSVSGLMYLSIYHNAVFSFSSQLIYIFFVNILTMIAVLFC